MNKLESNRRIVKLLIIQVAGFFIVLQFGR